MIVLACAMRRQPRLIFSLRILGPQRRLRPTRSSSRLCLRRTRRSSGFSIPSTRSRTPPSATVTRRTLSCAASSLRRPIGNQARDRHFAAAEHSEGHRHQPPATNGNPLSWISPPRHQLPGARFQAAGANLGCVSPICLRAMRSASPSCNRRSSAAHWPGWSNSCRSCPRSGPVLGNQPENHDY